MEFQEAVKQFYKKLGQKKIMALATSLNDHVMVRNVSVIIHGEKILFKTDQNFRKTKQLLENPQVAICYWGVQIEGIAVNHGLVVDQADQTFQKLYQKYWEKSYNAYPHKDNEILIEIVPKLVEIWDQDQDDHGFQLFIDFEQEKAEIEKYD
ncbi:pyridoxamine 5'-phosphate oxidase family protein [Enterococcus hulanensis]|uniref:Pyridoxamine 5'-phosphate oxidase family protein n=1 Tax=Enterococcus hulanensis TaxID=2559929 RepID=A0ABU3EV09_9ENTE|nr:pyridoxamine 5'-phosphate oxidase family protein [Enterococcus hulanensis]MDT2598517.1 pyridoxamine 5'-phosphate oxidase family protein [Enterococcus hulanensis]MDT2607978.1 pyridoxamine 5'-phosphate oxidase family protein [Enterococcus hulanensis]MDT2615273.1 pyridoxamine 5'-phosphate oxidase family protein [Enterococcus hulanensis]MDT2626756.1 pyridoxamine 5'-phosphate oxidase family protein [Enterococcus hulanensis]MDT2654345.1 pyridoxamine 5'-phosphate oxidase family protein [Enterococc